MSASEKLEALAERVINGPPGPPGKDDADLFAALPQIVAVVKAAEEVERIAADTRGWAGRQAGRAVTPALTALKQALDH